MSQLISGIQEKLEYLWIEGEQSVSQHGIRRRAGTLDVSHKSHSYEDRRRIVAKRGLGIRTH